METYTLICAVCNEPFMAKRKNAKTCSQSCRNVLSIGRRLTDNQNVITDESSTIISPVITLEKTPVITDKITGEKPIITHPTSVITGEKPIITHPTSVITDKLVITGENPPVITPELPIKTVKATVITGRPVTRVTLPKGEPAPTQKITEHQLLPHKEEPPATTPLINVLKKDRKDNVIKRYLHGHRK